MNEKMVDIEIDIDDKEFLYVAKLAHENDITFNEMINKILQDYLDSQEEQKDGTSNS